VFLNHAPGESSDICLVEIIGSLASGRWLPLAGSKRGGALMNAENNAVRASPPRSGNP
jgi:hypothetical protein